MKYKKRKIYDILILIVGIGLGILTLILLEVIFSILNYYNK